MILKNSKNLELIVDDDIPQYLLNYKWSIISKRNYKYAVTGIWNKITKYTDIFSLHRLLLNAPKGSYVDHINGNTLDNRLVNLRLATNTENIRNGKLRKNNTTGYKGVRRVSRNKLNPFTAGIMVNRKAIHLGYFKTAEDAAKAYDDATILYFKEFASPNFPKK